MDKDHMNTKQWAKNMVVEYTKTIQHYIVDGWDRKTAVETVLLDSCIGAGYKAQIRYEFLHN